MKKEHHMRAKEKEDALFGNAVRKGRGRERKVRQDKMSYDLPVTKQRTWGPAAWTDSRCHLSSPVFLLAQLIQIMKLHCCFNENGKQGR